MDQLNFVRYKNIKIFLFIVIGFFILIQLIPYGRNHTNPEIIREPDWDSPATREIASKACFDCHSNETNWTWYSNIAPASWLVQWDVEQARMYMNFSNWFDMPADSIIKVIENGEMPPFQYLLLHPDARLSDSEKQQFIEGIKATLQ